MKVAAKVVYGMLGVIWLAIGVVALCAPGRAVPADATSPVTLHFVREQGAHAVFLALISLWCIPNFERRGQVHAALILFAVLFAAIHWVEYFGNRRHILSPILNSAPALALALTAPFTRNPFSKL